jgi:ATP-dependent Clp protease adaptor protein ClpS
VGVSTPDLETQEKIQDDQQTQEPPLYRVLLHNDDYTTMAFVIEILMGVFKRNLADATRIMMNVHRKGIGVCGMYPYEIAETKVDTVEMLAKANGFPLKCSMEKA